MDSANSLCMHCTLRRLLTREPQAEGLTAIEAWMLACILFVFATLAEYAAILLHKQMQALPAKPALTAQKVQTDLPGLAATVTTAFIEGTLPTSVRAGHYQTSAKLPTFPHTWHTVTLLF